MRLENKVALITGAGSRIGCETALLFAREGARVVVVDVNDAAGWHLPPKSIDAGWNGPTADPVDLEVESANLRGL